MSTTTRSRRHTLLRTAVATAALAGALLAPTTAFAADAPKASPTAQAGNGELVKHVVLVDGTKADLWKKGKGWYYLDVYSEGSSQLGSLTVGGPTNWTEDGEQILGMWVTLDNSGQVRSWKNPASAHFADGGSETREGCTVTNHMGTPYEGLSLALSNGPKGPVARLIEVKGGRTLATLTGTGATGLAGGARIKAADDPKTPQFQMRVNGNVTPYLGVSFPEPLKDCGTKPTPKPSTTTKPAVSTQSGGQTKVVPKGSVAAGAELTDSTTSPDTTAWGVAAGASAAAVGGAGFVLLRRRAAKQQ